MPPPDDPSPLARRLLPWLAGAAAAGLGLTAIALVRLELDVEVASLAEGRANLPRLVPFWATSALGWAALTGVWACLARGAGRGARWRATAAIVGAALAARLVVLAGHEPVLSDDLHRYVFDGRTAAHGANPYLHTPLERRVALDEADPAALPDGADPGPPAPRWPGEAAVAALVNNPELHTIYLPASQWAFAAAGALVPDAWSGPAASGRVFRAGLLAAELALLGVLAAVLARRRRSPWWLALYAWHPLPLAEIAGSGHQDVLGVLLLVVALALWERRPRAAARWAAPLAAATLVKPFALPVALLMLRGAPARAWLRAGAAGAVVAVALAAPLLLPHDARPLRHLAATSQRFAQKWSHFGSVYEPTLWAIQTIDPLEDRERQWRKKERQERAARLACLALATLVVILVVARGVEPWTGARVMLLAMVQFSSTAHPWYLLWAFALVPVVPSPATWVASLTLPWGYAAWGYAVGPDGLTWAAPGWVVAAAYAPVYAALVWDVLRARARPPAPGQEHGA